MGLKKSEEQLKQARDFAIEKHNNQKYGKNSYIYHLDGVVDILKSYGYSINDQIVGYLHDVVEDTDTSIEEIKNIFGKTIANSVEAITDSPGKNRKERKEKTYKKLRKNRSALCVKLADRIFNIGECLKNKNKKLLTMYLKEHEGFIESLYGCQGITPSPLWSLYYCITERNFRNIIRVLVN